MSIGDSVNITSPNYPAVYPNSGDCVCHFHSTSDENAGSNFVVYIHDFGMEKNFDFLFVGNGSEVTDENTVSTLTDTIAPNSFVIPSAVMWMRFKSDHSSTQQGFFVRIEVTSNNGQGKPVVGCFF